MGLVYCRSLGKYAVGKLSEANGFMKRLPILYSGVGPDNAYELMRCDDINGGFISNYNNLIPETFEKIVKHRKNS